MECPKCDREMEMTHTYRVIYGRTQRWACGCGCVVTAQTAIVAIDPRRGQGAASLAQRLNLKGRAHKRAGRALEPGPLPVVDLGGGD